MYFILSTLAKALWLEENTSLERSEPDSNGKCHVNAKCDRRNIAALAFNSEKTGVVCKLIFFKSGTLRWFLSHEDMIRVPIFKLFFSQSLVCDTAIFLNEEC